jgi:hypothetical protein
MGKVKAYHVDCCGAIKEETEVVGIHPREDLFNKFDSFPVEFKHPERCEVHCCLDCYREKVLIPASNLTDRRNNERAYELKVQELFYALRQTVITRWRSKKRNLG